MVGRPTALVGRRALIPVGYGSDGDSSVAKAKAPGCKTEGFLSGSLVRELGLNQRPLTFTYECERNINPLN